MSQFKHIAGGRVMRTRDLAREMKSAFAAMNRRDIAHLVQLGVPEILIEHFQMVGVARVRGDRSGTFYEPDKGGRWAYITPICVQYADTPESTRPDAFPLIGNLVDLVAWHERVPERWLLRAGSAEWLGCIGPQYWEPEPVRIWRSPLQWLRNRCAGLVLLACERSEIYRLLTICRGGIDAEDEPHAALLLDILEHPWPAPEVCYPEGRRRAA
jgi:hypothetical protein